MYMRINWTRFDPSREQEFARFIPIRSDCVVRKSSGSRLITPFQCGLVLVADLIPAHSMATRRVVSRVREL